MESELDQSSHCLDAVVSVASSDTEEGESSVSLTLKTPIDSFTDAPALLEPREYQVCAEVVIVPGTTRRIPYVIPAGWRCVDNRVHIVQEIPGLPDLDYHVEPLSENISFHSRPHRGLLLCASIPLKYQHREYQNGHKTEFITTPLKLKLEIHLDKSSVPSEIDHRSDYVSVMGLSRDRIAFDAVAWKEYFGVEVDKEPQLPPYIGSILNSKAPFLLDEESTPQCIGDNHLLTLIPGRVNGEDFTLDKLGELILLNYNDHFTAFQGNNKMEPGWGSHGYGFYSKHITEATRQTPIAGAPYWVLLPKTILQDSRGKSFSDHEAMVAQYRPHGYQLPRALEVATSLLSHYARSAGERLYANENQRNWWTYTRCSDVDKDGDALAVGGFESSGLCVDSSYDAYAVHGVAAAREL